MTPKKSSPKLGTPISDVLINVTLVQTLVSEQHPDLSGLPIHSIDSGWDNIIFRLGDQFAVRLPRRQSAAHLILNEQTWLPHLANHLPMAIPVPYRIGKPTSDFPWCWSIIPWLSGKTADLGELSFTQAINYSTFLRSLHIPAPDEAPKNPVRGVPLIQRSAMIEERIKRLSSKTNFITPTIIESWYTALNTPIDVSATWIHGDLHPRNILVENGKIAGIIDWGDITSGDKATDLASIWMLFPQQSERQLALAEYGEISEATLRRAVGWAILFSVILIDLGLIDSPWHASIGEKTLQRILEDNL